MLNNKVYESYEKMKKAGEELFKKLFGKPGSSQEIDEFPLTA